MNVLRKWSSGPPALWLGAFVLFAVTVAALAVKTVVDDRANEIHRAELSSAAFVRLLLDHSERAVEDADKLLISIGDLAQDWDFENSETAIRIYRQMKRLIDGSPQIASAWIMDAQGLSVLDSWQYPPTTIKAPERAYFQAHRRGEAEPFIWKAELGSVTSKPRFTISRALRNKEGSFRGVVVAGIYTDYFASLYRETTSWAAARTGLVLLEGTPLALWMDGVPGPAGDYHAEIVRRAKADVSGTAVLLDDDTQRLVAWHRSERYPYFAVASQHFGRLLGEWRTRAVTTGLFAAVTILGFGGLAAFGIRSAGAERRAAMNEILLREVHHRVKNNLQIVASLIGLKGREAADPEARRVFDELVMRVNAVAQVHDLIQQSAASDQVHAASLLRALCAELERSSATPIEFKDEGASPIALQAAVPLMLAGNELITNAIKHAHGKVSVFCRRDAEEVVVQVRDDGDGLPEGFQPDATRRFGMRMVQALTSQIGARFSVLPSAQGAAFEIRLPALDEA